MRLCLFCLVASGCSVRLAWYIRIFFFLNKHFVQFRKTCMRINNLMQMVS